MYSSIISNNYKKKYQRLAIAVDGSAENNAAACKIPWAYDILYIYWPMFEGISVNSGHSDEIIYKITQKFQFQSYFLSYYPHKAFTSSSLK